MAEHGKKPRWSRIYDRHCPVDTDGCSRHVKMISEALRNKKSPLGKALSVGGWEAEHMAESMELTVIALWRAREKLRMAGLR